MGIREELPPAGKKSSTQFFAADLQNVALEIARGLETQYLIGYQSADTTCDGKWRLDVPPTEAPKESKRFLSMKHKPSACRIAIRSRRGDQHG
jgi:hypothetical protein